VSGSKTRNISLASVLDFTCPPNDALRASRILQMCEANRAVRARCGALAAWLDRAQEEIIFRMVILKVTRLDECALRCCDHGKQRCVHMTMHGPI
jgi:hypothetical protein